MPRTTKWLDIDNQKGKNPFDRLNNSKMKQLDREDRLLNQSPGSDFVEGHDNKFGYQN